MYELTECLNCQLKKLPKNASKNGLKSKISIDLAPWTLPRQLEKDASMLIGLWSHSKWAVPSTGLAPSQYRAGDRGAENCLGRG